LVYALGRPIFSVSTMRIGGPTMNCVDCGKEIREKDDTEYPWWCNDCCEKHFQEFMKSFEKR